MDRRTLLPVCALLALALAAGCRGEPRSNGDQVLKTEEVSPAITATPTREEQELLPSPTSEEQELLPSPTIEEQELLPSPSSEAERTAVILTRAQNEEPPWTPAEVEEKVFTASDSAAAWLAEISYGKATIDGGVFGWYVMPPETACDMDSQMSRAVELADVDADFSSYRRIVFVLPNATICFPGALGGTTTLATAEGQLTFAFLIQTTTTSPFFLATHEFAHSLGLYAHAASLDCGEFPIGGECGIGSDPFDVLTPGVETSHISAYFKEQLGWLGPSNIRDVVESGTYTIEPLEKNTDGVQLIRIPRSADANGNTSAWYYVEYRQPIGFDTKVVENAEGVYVRLRARHMESGYGALLLDMAPGDGDPHNSALAPGQEFEDPAGALTVTVEEADVDRAAVKILIQGNVGQDVSPPLVRLLAPYSYTEVSGEIVVVVEVSDDTQVARVEFWVDGKLMHTASPSLPFEAINWTWDTESYVSTSYATIIEVKAVDLAGNVGIADTAYIASQ